MIDLKYLVLLIWTTISFIISAQELHPNDLFFLQTKGSVKQITTHSFYASNRNKELKKTYDDSYYYKYEFDENGFIKAYSIVDTKTDSINSSSYLTYDTLKMPYKLYRVTFNKDTILEKTYKWKDSLLIKTIEYINKSTTASKIEHYYYSNRKLDSTSCKSYSNYVNQGRSYSSFYKYDEKGILSIEKTIFDNKDSTIRFYKHFKIIEQTSTKKGESDLHRKWSHYKFDENNNWIFRVRTLNNWSRMIETRTIEYYN